MDTATRSFASLQLSLPTLQSLEAKGYKAPTDCQAEAIPLVMAGRDLVVQSRTGTGKTAAFGIPIVEKVDPAEAGVQAVALTPTRELALQVSQELTELGRGRALKVETIYGGDSMDRQLEGLRAGAHIVVGTPGRVLDHLRRGTLKLDKLRVLVLDEADRMLDMGFAQEMGEIMMFVPATRQTLLFSATIPLGIKGLIYHYLTEPEWILLSEDQVYVTEVDHLYCLTPRLHKEAALYRLLEYEAPVSSMVFCNTREETRQVATFLGHRGLPVAMLSSDLPQKKREKVLQAFREGRVRHLVTTDVASRGIDIEDLSHVFIFSTPESPEQYIHRAGRTGRVGKSGRAISLLSAHDLMNFNRLVKRYHIKVRELHAPSDQQVQERKGERVVTELLAEAQQLSMEEFLDLAPVARRIADHEQGSRMVALLLRPRLQAVAPALDLGVDDEPAAGQPGRPAGAGRRRRPRGGGGGGRSGSGGGGGRRRR
jgi:ATP-dependent RNA helicase DeaD